MGLTSEETWREVRAHVAWGKGPNEIRSTMRKKGAVAGDVEEALREVLSSDDASFRRAGLLGIIFGAGLLFAAWKLGGAWLSSIKPHASGELPSPEAMTDLMMPGRIAVWRPAVALILLVLGASRLATGVHRLWSGGSGDRGR
jgi:hypothetical protein